MTAATIEHMQSSDSETPRYGENGQLLCHAKSKQSGVLCNNWAISGAKVCRMHGGSIPQVKNKAKLRLMELVDPAIATLAREMTTATSSKDRMAAANSILDRAGWGRVSSVEIGDARDLLIARLIALRDEQASLQQSLQQVDEANTVEGAVDGDESAAAGGT